LQLFGGQVVVNTFHGALSDSSIAGSEPTK